MYFSLAQISPEFCLRYGVGDWGYTEEEEARSFEHFKSWESSGRGGPLAYLSGSRGEKRNSLINVYPDFQSALCFLFPYSPRLFKGDFKMGHYVFSQGGEDYHLSLKKRLHLMGEEIVGEGNFKAILDIEPVLERDLACRSGLGWFGKNSMLIHKKLGSYFLIGSLLLSLKAREKKQLSLDTDHCGSCQACVDTCPTEAIDLGTRTLNASKCLSTFTIEIFKPSPAPFNFEEFGQVFGCDICQDICPWNQKIYREKASDLEGEKALLIEEFFFKRPLDQVIQDLEEMSNRGFRKKFEGTSLERTGRLGVLKNLRPFQKSTS